MFQINDYVVYGINGMCKVLDIGKPEITGIDQSKLYYKLKPVISKGSIIYIPVENENKGLRRIISKEEALMLIDDILNIDTIQITNNKFRDAQYKETMKKYNCRSWITLIKTLNLEKKRKLLEGKKFGSTETRYLHDAEEYLYSELSVPLEIPKEEVEDFISNRLHKFNVI